tara:strand:- start:523 stop:747 length:225 start_codon:yes stop_codon:yes gene_type:complete
MNPQQEKILKENYKTIKKIGNENLANDVKKNSERNIKGAMIGGALGVVLGIGMKKNILISGFIGIILGRLIIKK